jgi:hypothetical protein
MNRRVAIPLGVVAVLAGAMLWYLFGPRHVPPGQPPLGILNASSLEALRGDFNRDADRTRIILLLSPT